MTPTIISHHRLLCGDLTDVAALRALMGEERADVIYTDPPWGPRMVRFFGAMTSKAYVTPGDESCPEWTSFLDAFALVCATYRTPTAPVFVEMGLRWTNDLDAAMARARLPLLQRWRTTYGSAKKPTEASLGLYGAEPPNGVVQNCTIDRAVTPARRRLRVMWRKWTRDLRSRRRAGAA
jgi:hypothetical protein